MKQTSRQLRELADQIYEILDEMKEVLRFGAPGEYERAKMYWLAHIDGALENRGFWFGGSFISLRDTLRNIEEGEDEC